MHMRICYGNIHIKTKSKKTDDVGGSQPSQKNRATTCVICQMLCKDQESSVACLHCKTPFHIICLAKVFLGESGEFIPIDGFCPRCHTRYLWGELIRKKHGYDVIETNGSKSTISDDSDIEIDDLLN